jgi:NADP-dependent 3-hydroxy acid dehydrogenase YdfG
MTTSSTSSPVVLVTGVSSRLGAGIARRFAASGWRVAILARRLDKLQLLADELASQTTVEVIEGDVAQPETVKNLFNKHSVHSANLIAW